MSKTRCREATVPSTGICFHGSVRDDVVSVRSVIAAASEKLVAGVPVVPNMWPTGFSELDRCLDGGLRAGELTLLGGAPGLGKTTMALQMARNAVAAGRSAVYFCFEHEPLTLLERLICIEAGAALGDDGPSLRAVRAALSDHSTRSDLAGQLAKLPGGGKAARTLAEYGDRLLLHRSDGATSTPRRLRELVSVAPDSPLVVVDYLQKVPVPGASSVEHERVTVAVEALKDMALEFELPVLAIAAADSTGPAADQRLRMNHLRGSSSLVYEPDVVLMLNDKYQVVARHHLVYDVGNAERFRRWAVLTIEKNRSGPDRVDLEFRKCFHQARFDPEGQAVVEQLVDERVYVE